MIGLFIFFILIFPILFMIIGNLLFEKGWILDYQSILFIIDFYDYHFNYILILSILFILFSLYEFISGLYKKEFRSFSRFSRKILILIKDTILTTPDQLYRLNVSIKSKLLFLLNNNISSIADFLFYTNRLDGVSNISAGLGLNEIVINIFKIWFNLIPFLLITIGIILIYGGFYFLGSTYHNFHIISFNMMILQNETESEDYDAWNTKLECETGFSLATNCKVSITASFLKNMPEYILISGITNNFIIKNATTKIKEMRLIDNPYIGELRKSMWKPRKIIYIPTYFIEMPLNESYGNYFVTIKNRGTKFTESRLDFEFIADLKKIKPSSTFDRFKSGTLQFNIWAYTSEGHFLGFKKENSHLGLEQTKIITDKYLHSVSNTEVFWTPQLNGEFIGSSDSIGHYRFYIAQTTDKIDETFIFKTAGAPWLPYVGSILGVATISLGLALVRNWILRPWLNRIKMQK